MDGGLAEERFHRLVSRLEALEDELAFVKKDRFFLVFGNLIQEYIADLVYELSQPSDDYQDLQREAESLLSELFGENEFEEWPFRRHWIRKYLKSRHLGRRLGVGPETRRQGAHRDFERVSPKQESSCQWFLGCPLDEPLEKDHRWPYSIHGESSLENLQWLCEKHNSWKGDLVFWENSIPVSDFDDIYGDR